MTNEKLTRLTIKGFKSIDSTGQTLKINDINVIIGPNGAGKSNLISFFRMMNYLTTEALQSYIGQEGYASSLLHLGPKVTPHIQADFLFTGDQGSDEYSFVLTYAAGDRLIFTNESASWHLTEQDDPIIIPLGSGHEEARLVFDAKTNKKTTHYIYVLLSNCRVYHFHDTSSSAKIRGYGYIGDDRYLRSDAGNLAAFLYAMRENSESYKYYRRIVEHIRIALPHFIDFVLEPSSKNEERIRLNWRGTESDYLFGPHQLSDGSLRFMALTTLLLQPPSAFPRVIIVDEPELGLHPVAISELAVMIRRAALQCQIIVSTQSTRLLDEFSPEEIIVADYDHAKQSTLFKRLNRDDLKEWLNHYNISELWEKNIIGGLP